MKAAGRVLMPKDVQPMLATLTEKAFNNPDWIFELKLDGMRALVFKDSGRVDMRTRNAKALANRFPILTEAFLDVTADSMILDGEIVALDEKGHSHFNLIQPRIHLSKHRDIVDADEKIPVYFYAFDLLYLNGYDLMRFPLAQRKAVLHKLISNNNGWIRYTDHVEERGLEFFNAVAKHQLEGIVAKYSKSPYQQARSKHWLKIKTQQTDHFVIGGFTPPEGSRKYFGALLLGLYDRAGKFIHVGRAGGGFDDKTLVDVFRQLEPLVRAKSPFLEVPAEIRKSTWVEPRLVCEVRFNEWTSDRKLRAPVFEGLRDDINPEQCLLEDSIPSTAAKTTNTPNTKTEVRSSKTSTAPPVTRVELTNQDKILWPEDKLTKGDLVRFYDRITPYIQPHLQDRPLVFDRYPDGIYGQHFYQKDAHDYTPDWIRTQEIWSPDVERHIRSFIGADREQLLYIANMGAITQNPWSSRVQFLEYPDFVIFDLDPVEAPYSTVQVVAIEVRKVLDELHLRSYPKTSGASGIHVYLPILENTFTYEDVRVFAEAVASIIVGRLPEAATIERVVRKRKNGMVYVDFLQNVKGKTVASVYSPRAVAGGPVSTPLKWTEFNKPLDPKDYTMTTVFKRLDKYGDLFEPVLSDRQDISGFLGALRKRR
jgi:bifunctional non-homologous end joining protein LigD